MQPPAPPSPPAATVPPLPGVVDGATQVVIDGGRPVTAMDAATLRNRRSELSRQLESADSRRQELAAQLRSAPPGSQAGLVARIEVLDQRIVQIEKDIAQNGQRLASLPATATTSEGVMDAGQLSNGQITGISIVFIIFVLMPLAIAVGRLLWKRGSVPRPAALPAGTDQRLERMEQGMDAIAIEVERISEGQRFVTRLLADRQELPALGGVAGAQPVPLQRDER